ncbi:unnamed protein product, partial [Discosporangium mesarthrocarpum]
EGEDHPVSELELLGLPLFQNTPRSPRPSQANTPHPARRARRRHVSHAVRATSRLLWYEASVWWCVPYSLLKHRECLRFKLRGEWTSRPQSQ